MDVFILTYRGIDYFNNWFTPSNYADTTNFHVVDNGQQIIPENIKPYIRHSTSKNIGCAGGLNLICDMAFTFWSLDKIIIGQDDGQFTQSMLDKMWNDITPDTLVGGYNRSFDFALFGIHKDLYNSVGRFDENFIFGGCEDNDYKHRMKLAGKTLRPMNFDANLNCSLSSKIEGDVLRETGKYNAIYIQLKWGENYEFEHPFNNPSLNKDNIEMQQGIIDVYGNIDEYPSLKEYKEFVTTALRVNL